MTEYLDKKQENISQIADSFIDFTIEANINSNTHHINPIENTNLLNLNNIRELRPFKCNYSGCNKDYSNKSRLEIHLRTHTGDKPFKCEKCGRSFNEKGNLKIHYRIHTGEKPYKCSFQGCSKEFKAYGHLSDHLKRHFNIRPFKCDICNACFSRRNTLKTHIMTHTGEKPHKCTFPNCNKRFSEKGNMKTHYKTHTKNNKKKFPYSENLELDENLYLNQTMKNCDREYTESPKVQRCTEYTYLGSKTTSSTSLVPLCKKQRNELEMIQEIQIKNVQPQDDETEICTTPNPYTENPMQQEKTISAVNSNIKLITIENFAEKFNTINNSIKTNNLNKMPSYNGSTSEYNKKPTFNNTFEQSENVKMSQLNTCETVNSSIPEFFNYGSTSDSPLQNNISNNLEINKNCCTNLNSIFNEEFFQRPNYRSNYREFLRDDDDYPSIYFPGITGNNNDFPMYNDYSFDH